MESWTYYGRHLSNSNSVVLAQDFLVKLMQILVHSRTVAIALLSQLVFLIRHSDRCVWELGILRDHVDDIHTESRASSFEPEVHHIYHT